MNIHIKKAVLKRIFFVALQFLFAFIAVIFILSYRIESLAKFLEINFASPARLFLSQITSIVGLSIFELFIAFSPIIIALAVWKCFRFPIKKATAMLLVAVEVLLLCYGVTLGIPSVYSNKISHGVGDVSDSDIISAAEWVVSVISSDEIISAPDKEDILEMSLFATKSFFADYPSKAVCAPKPKISLLSEFLTDANILAYYAFPTSEIMINGIQPEYMMSYTAVHELAHFFGITREDEANLFAFRALFESNNQYLRYAAALRAYEYLAYPLYHISYEKYSVLSSNIPKFAKEDLLRSYKFSVLLGNGKIGEISNAANDAALSLRDDRGAKSYSNTARLLTAYIMNKIRS